MGVRYRASNGESSKEDKSPGYWTRSLSEIAEGPPESSEVVGTRVF